MTPRDPQGKRALFSDSNATNLLPPPSTRGGKTSLYSTAERKAGTLVVECSSCHGRSRVNYVEFAIRQLPIALWIPWRHYSRFMTCPACGHRRWLAARWLA
jgi:hypothetical protein